MASPNPKARVWIRLLLVALVCVYGSRLARSAEEGGDQEPETPAVVTLGEGNFTGVVSELPIVVVEFYAPWCGHCKMLAPEYEKAASVLRKHDPPIVLAKVDADEEGNKELASQYEVKGYPTIKILRDGGKKIQEYKGPREAEGIVEYLKKQAGPASTEIKSSEDAANLIDEKKIHIVGIFPSFSGQEYEKFIDVAEKMRSDYEFSHTIDAKFIASGDSTIKGPVVRLLKPFDELFVDSEVFEVDALEQFIEVSSIPVVTTFDKDPSNHPYVMKFFNSPNVKTMLFLNFSSTEKVDAFLSKYHEVAKSYKGENVSFLVGDLEVSESAFQYFGLKADQAPLIFIQTNDAKKFLKVNIEPDQIPSWLKEFMDGTLTPYRKSEPIPPENNDPVKTVVSDNFHDMVSNSGKNVLIEFYAPWCGHCKKLAPILEEVAVSFQNDADVVIAKMDATVNDVPSEFNVRGFPTLYLSSASGKLVEYDGSRTAEDITGFVEKNRDSSVRYILNTSTDSDSAKDEL